MEERLLWPCGHAWLETKAWLDSFFLSNPLLPLGGRKGSHLLGVPPAQASIPPLLPAL